MVIKIKKSGIIAAAALLPANELKRLCACVHANMVYFKMYVPPLLLPLNV